jgi:hypothetical protein
MNRVLIALTVVALGASGAAAASPEVDKAIKTIQSVGAAKMQQFCDLLDATEPDEEAPAAAGKAAPADKAAAEKEDPAVEQEVDGLLAQLGSDFATAWEAGEDLDENSPDGKAYNGLAMEMLA